MLLPGCQLVFFFLHCSLSCVLFLLLMCQTGENEVVGGVGDGKKNVAWLLFSFICVNTACHDTFWAGSPANVRSNYGTFIIQPPGYLVHASQRWRGKPGRLLILSRETRENFTFLRDLKYTPEPLPSQELIMMGLRGGFQSPSEVLTQTLCPYFVGFESSPLLEKISFLGIPFPIWEAK